MSKSTTKDKKELAKTLYLHTDMRQAEIADKVGLTQSTVSRYIKEGNWEELKGANSLNRDEIVANLYRKAKELSEQDDMNADAMIKMASAIEKLNSYREDGGKVLLVFDRLNKFVIARDYDFGKKLMEYQEAFLDTYGEA